MRSKPFQKNNQKAQNPSAEKKCQITPKKAFFGMKFKLIFRVWSLQNATNNLVSNNVRERMNFWIKRTSFFVYLPLFLQEFSKEMSQNEGKNTIFTEFWTKNMSKIGKNVNSNTMNRSRQCTVTEMIKKW